MPIDWSKLDDNGDPEIPARPDTGIWTLVRSYVTAPQIIRIEARGRWSPAPELGECGPDGFRHWAYGRDMLLTKRAPFGALIGKIGGSNIGCDEADIFLVGSLAVLTVEKASGPLFLTINDAPGCFDDNAGVLTLGPVAEVVEIRGGVISGLWNEPDSAVRRRWRLHHGAA